MSSVTRSVASSHRAAAAMFAVSVSSRASASKPAGVAASPLEPDRDRAVVAAVVVARGFGCAGGVELFGGVLADHLQQPVAGGAVAFVALHERLRHQRREKLDRVELVGADPGRDRDRAVEVEATHAHREPIEQRPLVAGKEVVGPVDRGA